MLVKEHDHCTENPIDNEDAPDWTSDAATLVEDKQAQKKWDEGIYAPPGQELKIRRRTRVVSGYGVISSLSVCLIRSLDAYR